MTTVTKKTTNELSKQNNVNTSAFSTECEVDITNNETPRERKKRQERTVNDRNTYFRLADTEQLQMRK